MTYKKRLVLTTAIVGLAAGLGVGQAQAFDSLHWKWDANVDQNNFINKWVWGDFYPSGLAQIEKLQVNIGDTYSEVKFSGSYAGPTSTDGSTTVLVDLGTLDFHAGKTANTTADGSVSQNLGTTGDVNPSLTGLGLSNFSYSGPAAAFNLDATIELGTIEVSVPTIQPGSLDATTQLAHVIGTSTSVGNFDSISSTVETEVHTGQFNLGNLSGGSDYTGFTQNYDGWGNTNEYHSYAEQLAAAIANGYVQQADVTSKARAGSWWNPIDAAVQLDSFAAGNVETVSLQSTSDPSLILPASRNTSQGGGWVQLLSTSGHWENQTTQSPTTYYPVATDQVLVGDITQFNYGNVTSTAKSYQNLTAFNNLGLYNGLGEAGLVSKLTSSSFGNFSQISVSGPPAP